MEFPPETYDDFEADQFETARARLTGDAVMEVMLQMRPNANGRCLDHYRIALDGTVLETQVVATNVFRALMVGCGWRIRPYLGQRRP